jgi:hypothetical protein
MGRVEGHACGELVAKRDPRLRGGGSALRRAVRAAPGLGLGAHDRAEGPGAEHCRGAGEELAAVERAHGAFCAVFSAARSAALSAVDGSGSLGIGRRTSVSSVPGISSSADSAPAT